MIIRLWIWLWTNEYYWVLALTAILWLSSMVAFAMGRVPLFVAFIGIFLVSGLTGLAALATGRAFARAWSPAWLVVPAMAGLAAADSFLCYTLFGVEPPLLQYVFLVYLMILLAVGWFGYQTMRAQQMSTQYSWEFARAGISWRAL
jgi:hypothetical protein